MNNNERRNRIIELLSNNSSPISGTSLAKTFSVSRQVIVQDVALLRSSGYDILSTNKGYLLNSTHNTIPMKVIKVSHKDDQIADELCTIVDLGGKILDVFVSHKVYGKLSAKLNISSRRDIKSYLEDIKSGKSTPLKNITSDYHYHTICADNEETLNLIYQELKSKGYLVKIDDWDWDNIISHRE